MALQGQAPIVPVAIQGARDAMKKGSLVIRPVRVTVRFGPADRDRRADARRPRRADRARRATAVADSVAGGRDMEVLRLARRRWAGRWGSRLRRGSTSTRRSRSSGLASRYGWVALPPQFQVFDNDWIIGTALVLYVVEFVADKIPWVDSVWDAVHSVIRPVGGAADRRRHARRAVPGHGDDGRAARRRARREHPLQKAGTRVDGQRQPRAVLATGPSASAKTSSSSASGSWR